MEQKKFGVVVALDLGCDVIWLNINFLPPIDFTGNLPNIITVVEDLRIVYVIPLELIHLNIEEILRNSAVITNKTWHRLHWFK